MISKQPKKDTQSHRPTTFGRLTIFVVGSIVVAIVASLLAAIAVLLLVFVVNDGR